MTGAREVLAKRRCKEFGRPVHGKAPCEQCRDWADREIAALSTAGYAVELQSKIDCLQIARGTQWIMRGDALVDPAEVIDAAIAAAVLAERAKLHDLLWDAKLSLMAARIFVPGDTHDGQVLDRNCGKVIDRLAAAIEGGDDAAKAE